MTADKTKTKQHRISMIIMLIDWTSAQPEP